MIERSRGPAPRVSGCRSAPGTKRDKKSARPTQRGLISLINKTPRCAAPRVLLSCEKSIAAFEPMLKGG